MLGGLPIINHHYHHLSSSIIIYNHFHHHLSEPECPQPNLEELGINLPLDE